MLSNTLEVSDYEHLILDYSNFNIGKQISLVEGLSRRIAATYEKIERMTQMNIQLYQDIEEALGDD
jgi:hypothetical protein